MPNRLDVVAEARQWIGTPYHHRQWLKGQGADCIGLVIGVARRSGVFCPPDHVIPEYGPFPHDHVAERTADLFMREAGAGWDDALPGQVGLFYWKERRHGQHFCIFGESGTMIHAFMGIGRVVEQGVSDFWRKRLIKTYDFRGLT